MKKTTFGTLINNSGQKLPNGRYSKNRETFFKNISLFRPHQRGNFLYATTGLPCNTLLERAPNFVFFTPP